jgi:hypothetical protein
VADNHYSENVKTDERRVKLHRSRTTGKAPFSAYVVPLRLTTVMSIANALAGSSRLNESSIAGRTVSVITNSRHGKA